MLVKRKWQLSLSITWMMMDMHADPSLLLSQLMNGGLLVVQLCWEKLSSITATYAQWCIILYCLITVLIIQSYQHFKFLYAFSFIYSSKIMTYHGSIYNMDRWAMSHLQNAIYVWWIIHRIQSNTAVNFLMNLTWRKIRRQCVEQH